MALEEIWFSKILLGSIFFSSRDWSASGAPKDGVLHPDGKGFADGISKWWKFCSARPSQVIYIKNNSWFHVGGLNDNIFFGCETVFFGRALWDIFLKPSCFWEPETTKIGFKNDSLLESLPTLLASVAPDLKGGNRFKNSSDFCAFFQGSIALEPYQVVKFPFDHGMVWEAQRCQSLNCFICIFGMQLGGIDRKIPIWYSMHHTPYHPWDWYIYLHEWLIFMGFQW